MDVSQIMSRKIRSVDVDTKISECSRIMSEENISTLLVVKNDTIVGIITEKDILKAVTNNIPPNTNVKKILHENIISVDPYTSIEEAAKIMIEKDIRRLPVLSKGTCVGIITMKDILKALLRL